MILIDGGDGCGPEFRLLSLACNHGIRLIVRVIQYLWNNMRVGDYVKAIVQHKTGTQKIYRRRPCFLDSSYSNYRWFDMLDSCDKLAPPQRGNKHKPENTDFNMAGEQ